MTDELPDLDIEQIIPAMRIALSGYLQMNDLVEDEHEKAGTSVDDENTARVLYAASQLTTTVAAVAQAEALTRIADKLDELYIEDMGVLRVRVYED